jgi:hypothetical protein
MGKSAPPGGEIVVLGESRIWPAVAIPAVAAAALALVAVIFRWAFWYGLAAVAASLVLAVTGRRNAVLADQDGLLIRGRGGVRRSYAWTEIERMGWRDSGIWGSTLVVHPRGGPYDVPGPNAPVNVWRIWRPGRRRSADPLPGLMKRHGIKSLLDP